MDPVNIPVKFEVRSFTCSLLHSKSGPPFSGPPISGPPFTAHPSRRYPDLQATAVYLVLEKYFTGMHLFVLFLSIAYTA